VGQLCRGKTEEIIMKGIVRKRLAALLSVAGFAGTASHATAQVLKGSEPGDKAKTERTIKRNKTAQEDAASKDAVTAKMRKAGGEQTAAGAQVEDKRKLSKTGNENAAASANAAHKASISSGGDRSKTDAQIKMNKAGAEKTSATSASGYKEAKSKAATGAAQKKMDQASPK
jgi:hypothetical protein